MQRRALSTDGARLFFDRRRFPEPYSSSFSTERISTTSKTPS